VLRRAAREPDVFFIALDADALAMADGSRRAARPTRKGGRENVVFLAAAAEELPGHLWALADEATVILPWRSLFAAVLEPEGATFAGISGTVKPGGELTVLVSAQERDRIAGTIELDDAAAGRLAARYTAAGMTVVECRTATKADVLLHSSGWGQRLGIPNQRAAWLFRLRVNCQG
jgi:hypothetical protein